MGFGRASLALIVGAELNQNMDLVAIKASAPSSSTDAWAAFAAVLAHRVCMPMEHRGRWGPIQGPAPLIHLLKP